MNKIWFVSVPVLIALALSSCATRPEVGVEQRALLQPLTGKHWVVIAPERQPEGRCAKVWDWIEFTSDGPRPQMLRQHAFLDETPNTNGEPLGEVWPFDIGEVSGDTTSIRFALFAPTELRQQFDGAILVADVVFEVEGSIRMTMTPTVEAERALGRATSGGQPPQSARLAPCPSVN